jgi:hypothetical protein
MSTPRSPDSIRLRRLLVLALLCGLGGGAGAAGTDELKAQRAQIEAARRQANAVYAEREKRCQEQFVVTSCVEDARAERRTELDRLSREQSVVDEALRKQRAAERLQVLADKQRAARQRASEPLPPPRVLLQKPPRAAQPAAPGSSPRGERLGVIPKDRSTPAERRDNKAAYERRLKQAEEHRRLVEERNNQRAVEAHKPASGLPTPAPSELPR